ncbi:MAG: 4Fe-4S binding protein [Candidatus Aenigmarchaeota archaeon]|nr:4Fe-4S binding protein [Candidatus Aenigmarchaeota archaeon]
MIEDEKIKYLDEKGIPALKAEEAKTEKTGKWRVFKPIINEEKCIKCKLCWLYCPENVITIDKNGHPKINYEICKGCGVCADNCPVKAINMKRDFHEEEK